MIDYEGRRFTSTSNSSNGDVDRETVFLYRQHGKAVWATYSGPMILFGALFAEVDDRGELEMVYRHVSESGRIKSGRCHSVPEILPDGRIRLHESWQWSSGDQSSGTSIIEEVRLP